MIFDGERLKIENCAPLHVCKGREANGLFNAFNL